MPKLSMKKSGTPPVALPSAPGSGGVRAEGAGALLRAPGTPVEPPFLTVAPAFCSVPALLGGLCGRDEPPPGWTLAPALLSVWGLCVWTCGAVVVTAPPGGGVDVVVLGTVAVGASPLGVPAGASAGGWLEVLVEVAVEVVFAGGAACEETVSPLTPPQALATGRAATSSAPSVVQASSARMSRRGSCVGVAVGRRSGGRLRGVWVSVELMGSFAEQVVEQQPICF
jgi:hypothetical protein